MAIKDQKITATEKNQYNVKSVKGSRLTGTVSENKNVFDRLVEFFIDKYNALIDEIVGGTFADDVEAQYEGNTKALNDILSDIEAEILARYTASETDALVTQTTNPLVNGFDLNLTTGVITVTYKDGTVKTWDTPLEKVPAKFEFVEEDGSYYLKVTNEDGSSTKTNVTSLMNIYGFESSDTLVVNTSTSGTTTTVTATVKEASIEKKHMALSLTTQFEEWVTQASNSASEAAGSEKNAAAYAENAKTSETNAATSEKNAASSASAAATSETKAKTSEGNAATSEKNAASSEKNAKDSDDSAAISATNAKTSETNAKTSETNAKTSETNAAASEASASTSEKNAAASETEASTQASLAKSYANGTSGARTGEETDNSKYYSEQAKSYATSASSSASSAATSEQSAATYAAELQGGIDKALAQAKASGEFDGEKGDKGEDGKTPVRGTDYWTDADKAEIVEDVNQSIDLSTYAKKTELDNYLPLKGGTCTGGITAPNFQTGSDESAYFQTKKMRGQGAANSYQHAVDWGYSGHNQVDFYEYGGIWNFWQCQSASKTNAVLRGSITNNGYEGSAALTGTPTAPTAAEGTNSTQIATTAFVQAAIGSIPEIEVITNAEIDTIVAA